MDGLIVLNKPAGLSSAKALYRVRKLTGERKSGHAGTLDPAAEGVLVLCLGAATKLVEQLMDQPKLYRAAARLDVTSDSFDSDRPLRPVQIGRVPEPADVAAAMRQFEGEILQAPPAISALKVGGRPAYKLERAGRAVELQPRRVRVYWTEVRRYAWPAVDFEVACGRGTYVRALIRDLGVALNTGGCLTHLTRRAVGPFRIEDAWTLPALEAGQPVQYLITLQTARELVQSRNVPPRNVVDRADLGPDDPA
jgi:tRNA pseudouridine55 synthase